MSQPRFLDRENPPDQKEILHAIGKEILPVWHDTLAFLKDTYQEYQPELIFYNSQQGWGYRYRKETHQLCILFPGKGGFTALVALNPSEDEAALEKIHFFNARIRELLNQPSSLPQGRWLWMRVEDHTDFVGFRLLMEIKKQVEG
jgi:hypothetical protein